LSYPTNWHQLVDPDAPPHPLMDDREVGELLVIPDERREGYIPPSISASDTTDLDMLLIPERKPAAEEPFTLLPAAEHRLAGEVQRLERSGTYRVLHHAAWRQPLGPRARTPWILVRGGQTYGDHYELEGALRIYLERALFAQVNLWKTRFELTELVQTDDAPEWPVLPPWPARFGADTPLFETLARESRQREDQQQQPANRDSLAPPQEFARTGNNWGVGHITAINRAHRLELGDLLYLDHPEFGVLVHVIRYQPDSPDEEEILILED